MNNYLNRINLKGLIIILFSRLFLFAFFQMLIALVLSSWLKSEKYWLLTATLTNIISIVLLVYLLKKEGIKYLSLFRFGKEKWIKDFSIFIGLAIISMPVVLLPSLTLSEWIWGNTTYYHQVLFQSIPKYMIYLLLFAFPLTMGFAVLPAYFGYIMPRLKNNFRYNCIALFLPVVFFSLEHCTMPLIFDIQFIIFRSLMYLPFVFILGFALYKRPALLPYLSILYGLIYTLPVISLITGVY